MNEEVRDWLIAAVVVFTGFWLVSTILFWLMEHSDKSLLEVLKMQWTFVSGLRLW